MSIRDIIEASKQDSHGAYFTQQQVIDAAAEVALMEAAVTEARRITEGHTVMGEHQSTLYSASVRSGFAGARAAVEALAAYRAERGL